MSRRGSIWVQAAAIVAILLVAAFLRLWQIDKIPPGFHFDESYEGLEAWKILTDPHYRPIFLTGNFGVLPLNSYANALTFAVAQWLGSEAGPTAMRITAALFGLLGVSSLFALGLEMRRRAPDLISPALPWLAAATLAGMRWHIHFSRMGIEPIIVPMAWALTTWLLLRAWRTGAWWTYGALGISVALAMYSYQDGWMIPPLIAISALLLLWEDRADREKRGHRWSGLIVAGIISVLGVLPLLLFFLHNPAQILLRPSQVVNVGPNPSTVSMSVPDSLWATAKMFGPFGLPGDRDPRRNIPGEAALNLWEAIPFYAGLLIALWHSRRTVMALPVIGLLGLLLPGVFTEYAPHFHRILGASAPAALLCGIGLDGIWRLTTTTLAKGAQTPGIRWLGPLLAFLLILAGTWQSAQDYFVRWAKLPDLFYAFDVGLWDLGQWIENQHSDNPIYISPDGAEHPTLAFAWRTRPSELTQTAPPKPVRYDGRYLFPLTAAQNQLPEQYAVIEHEDFRTPLLLPSVFPTATIVYTVTDPAGQLFAQVYKRPADTLPMRSPKIALAATLGDGINLIGYDIQPQPVRVGGSLYVQYHWQVDAAPATNWTVFTHVIDSSGKMVAGFDSPPGRGSLVTTRWQPGWRVLDEYEIMLPADLPPGEYTLRMGLYDAGGKTMPAGGGGIELGPVKIE